MARPLVVLVVGALLVSCATEDSVGGSPTPTAAQAAATPTNQPADAPIATPTETTAPNPTATASEPPGESGRAEDALAERATAHLAAFSDHDWAAAYEFLPPAFRASCAFDIFAGFATIAAQLLEGFIGPDVRLQVGTASVDGARGSVTPIFAWDGLMGVQDNPAPLGASRHREAAPGLPEVQVAVLGHGTPTSGR